MFRVTVLKFCHKSFSCSACFLQFNTKKKLKFQNLYMNEKMIFQSVCSLCLQHNTVCKFMNGSHWCVCVFACICNHIAPVTFYIPSEHALFHISIEHCSEYYFELIFLRVLLMSAFLITVSFLNFCLFQNFFML